MIDYTKVKSIYTGKDRVCRCGCKGDYVKRGEELFDVRLNRFRKMLRDYDLKRDDVCEGEFINVSYGKNSAITIYFD